MTTTNNQKRMKFVIFSLAILLLSSYSLFQAKNLILGPVLSIDTPVSGETLNESVITVTGKARNISHITLNDSAIYVDEKGSFKEKMIIPSGYSIIKLSVTDRFGRTETKLIEVSNLDTQGAIYASIIPKVNPVNNNL